MVLAQELTATALIESLENGHFYSSSGVVLESVRSDGKSLTVKAQSRGDETFTFEFLGTRKSTPLDGEPILDKDGQPLATTHRYSDKVGEVLKTSSGESATYEFDGDELYVRCRVTSSQKHPNPSEIGEHERAWTQPVIPE